MNVIVTNEQQDLSISKKQVVAIVKSVVNFEGKKYNEVSVNFVNTEKIIDLHREYFDDPSPTDCISFPLSDEEAMHGINILGDIFICPQTAIEYAKEHQIPSYDEVTLYIIHGLLHLMGYDDITEEQQITMRKAEKRHMDDLKQKQLCLRA